MLENKIGKQNTINNFLNNYFNIFVVIFTSFLLILSYFLILKPKVDATTLAISDNISQQQKIYQTERTKLYSLEKSIEAYKEVNPVDMERVNSILPSSYDKERLFGELEEIITANGYKLNSITISKEGEEAATNNDNTANANPGDKVKLSKASENIGLINVSVSIGGIDYASLKNFLSVLENNLRLFDVTSVSLGGRSADLQLLTYYYKK